MIFGKAGMAGAKGGVDVRCGKPAAAAVGETMGTASGVVDEAGFSGLLRHISSFWIWSAGVHPRAMRMVVKTRELREKQFVRI